MLQILYLYNELFYIDLVRVPRTARLTQSSDGPLPRSHHSGLHKGPFSMHFPWSQTDFGLSKLFCPTTERFTVHGAPIFTIFYDFF